MNSPCLVVCSKLVQLGSHAAQGRCKRLSSNPNEAAPFLHPSLVVSQKGSKITSIMGACRLALGQIASC